MDESERRRRYTRCSFCGKGQDQVRKLVAGPGVYICDACIRLCNEVLDEDIRAGGIKSRSSAPPPRAAWRRLLTWRPWRMATGTP